MSSKSNKLTPPTKSAKLEPLPQEPLEVGICPVVRERIAELQADTDNNFAAIEKAKKIISDCGVRLKENQRVADELIRFDLRKANITSDPNIVYKYNVECGVATVYFPFQK
jgi:monomeric isocitrate dehydrogenase